MCRSAARNLKEPWAYLESNSPVIFYFLEVKHPIPPLLSISIFYAAILLAVAYLGITFAIVVCFFGSLPCFCFMSRVKSSVLSCRVFFLFDSVTVKIFIRYGEILARDQRRYLKFYAH